MSKIVNIPGPDAHQDVFPVARIIQTTMKEEKYPDHRIEAFVDNFVALVQKGDNWGIFSEYAEQYDLLARMADKKQGVKEERLECYFSTMIYLWQQVEGLTKLEAAVNKVVHLLTISSEFAKLRLRMLFTCYNSIPVTSKTGHLSKSIFFSTLEFAKEQKIFGELIPYLPHLERWVDSWKQPDVSESLKELCYIVAHELASVDESLLKTHLSVDSREAATLEWLHKYLLKETEVSPKLSEAVAWFCRLIIGTPNVYEVENWIEVPVLEKAKSADQNISKYMELLGLFVKGGITDLDGLLAKHPGLLEKLGVSKEAVAKKIRVLTLCTLCEGKKQVSLSDIEKALNTSDVDEVIITAVHHGVLMGRIDECGGVLNVQAVLRRQFSMAEWKELDGQLDRWIGKLDQLKVIYNRA